MDDMEMLRNALKETSARLRNALDNEPGDGATDLVMRNHAQRVELLEREQQQLVRRIAHLMTEKALQASSPFIRREFKL